MKKLLSAALALCLALSLCVPAFAAENTLDNFQKTAAYQNNFTGVSATNWAAPSVQTCYEYGLMKGASATSFNPGGTLTVAEALTMADRVHEIFTTGQSTLKNGSPWYQSYVDYALENGIIQEGDFTSYTAKVTRQQMAYIFYNALPASALPAINTVYELPDIDDSFPYADEVFALYDAGVLTGSDAFGTVKPDATITRAEAAAIIARVAIPAQRKTVTLLSQWQWGDDVELAVPQDAEDMTAEFGVSTVFSLKGSAICNSEVSNAYLGAKITDLPADTMNEVIALSFEASGMVMSDSATTAVAFGAIPVYRTTCILTNEDDLAQNAVIFTYISGDELNMIALISEDGAVLKSMANNLRIASCTASPKL